MNILTKNLLDKICKAYQIGELLGEPLALSGGLLHSTWKIKTETGFYVIKKLNPAVSAQKDRYRLSEKIGEIFSKSISAIPALKQKGDFIFSDENESFLVFPYKNASILTQQSITAEQVKKIATALSNIHRTHIAILNPPAVELFSRDVSCWRTAYEALQNKAPLVAENLLEKVSVLEDIHREHINLLPILQNNLVISHRDFDPKNVLWDEAKQYYLIDWESAGLINKTKDLMATAIYWSFDEKYQVNVDYFFLFLETYSKNGGSIEKNEIKAGFYGFLADWLNWLDFNISRMLNNPRESAEFSLGAYETQNTLKAIKILLSQEQIIIEKAFNPTHVQ